MGISTISFSQKKSAAFKKTGAGVTAYSVTFDAPLTAEDGVVLFLSSNGSVSVNPVFVGGGAENLLQVPALSTSFGTAQIWYFPYVAGGETGITVSMSVTDNQVTVLTAGVWKKLVIETTPEDVRTSQGTSTSAIGASTQPTDVSNLCVAMVVSTIDTAPSTGVNLPWLNLDSSGHTGASVGVGLWQQTAYVIQGEKSPAIATWPFGSSHPWWTYTIALGGLILDTSRVEVEQLYIQTFNTSKPQPDEMWLLADRTFEASNGDLVLGGVQAPAAQKVPIIQDMQGRLIGGAFTGDNSILPNRVGTTGLCSLYSLWLMRAGKRVTPLYQDLVIPDTITPTTWQQIFEYNKDL